MIGKGRFVTNSPLSNEVKDGKCRQVAQEEDAEAQEPQAKKKDQTPAEKIVTS